MQTEFRAASVLLDKGIKVPAAAPLFLRVIGKRRIGLTIRQPYLGTMHRISLIYATAGIESIDFAGDIEENAMGMYKQYAKPMAAIAAQAWLNSFFIGWLFGWAIKRWMLWAITPIILYTICKIISGSYEDFTNSIVSVRAMRTTAPRTSHEDQGS